MNEIENPFSPGAGTPPPELAGRDEIRHAAEVATARVNIGNPAKGILMVGLRGVGKTVLLNAIRRKAESNGLVSVYMEAPEERSLPALLAPELRIALLKLSRNETAKKLAQRALRGLAGFAKSLKFKYQDIEMGFDFAPEPGLADNGDFEHDLQELLSATCAAARQANTAIIIFIDELQYVKESEMAALVMAMHRAAQQQDPILLIGAGLPHIRAKMGRAKSYAERLFDYPGIGPLDKQAACDAIRKPIEFHGARITSEAIDSIVNVSEGYPYFLQEWGKRAWEIAPASPITKDHVLDATPHVIASLDASFFRVRFDRLTPSEKRYLRAMAELGRGPHRSGSIAEMLHRPVSSLAPTRSQLIAKGMIWSPSHGDAAFTVPLFEEFMLRIMPHKDW